MKNQPILTIDDLMREAAYEGMFPLSEPWTTGVGVLDILHGRTQIEEFLATQKDLPADLVALRNSARDWRRGDPIRVGESGTLYRLLMYAAEKLGQPRIFEPEGTLLGRGISKDTDAIVRECQRDLLKRDGGTHWASAAVLLGDPERLPDAEPELVMSYEAYDYWQEQCGVHDLDWEPRLDQTIIRQARTFLELMAYQQRPKLERETPDYTPPPPRTPRVVVPEATPTFVPRISEDFCFGYAFGYTTLEEGARRWPKLAGHESNRLREMPRLMAQMRSYDGSKKIDAPPDHRLVQAIALRAAYDGPPLGPDDFEHPECVSKSWPRFWDFLAYGLEKILGPKRDTELTPT